MKTYHLLFLAGLILLLFSAAFGVAAQEPPPEPPVGEPPSFLQDIYEQWVESPHADVSSEAFVHWDADGEVSDRCARCHSTPGYLDYLGVDGSEAGVVDAPAPIGTVINCDTCHNAVASNLSTVTFPSGAEVSDLGDSARCMVCHQGRASSVQVNAALEEAGVLEDMNAVSPDLGFINIHYYAAAASLLGSEAQGGYEFEGQTYQRRFDHVDGYNTCDDCHQPHSLELRIAECAGCHAGVESPEDLRNIRMEGSLVDYDGDGNPDEGIAEEIETLQEMLYQSIQQYAAQVVGTPIVYDEHSHPYFFIDSNANGTADASEANGDNAYNSFTGNLLKATYNYQVSLKDPGNYAHNAKYHIELLYDSIMVLNAELGEADAEGLEVAQITRNDAGHFDSTGEPFRHWDAEGEVPGTCAKCHTAEGLPQFLQHGATIGAEPSNSLSCMTCHDDISDFSVFEIQEVPFPSGAVIGLDDEESNLCLHCHQGRESTVSVNSAIQGAGVGPNEVSERLRFRNPHYFAAGATIFGNEAMGAYQFDDREYSGYFTHQAPINTCIDCHDQHSLELRENRCVRCHEDVESSADIFLIRHEAEGTEAIDYDGDGDTSEPIRAEVEGLHEALLVAIQDYTSSTLGQAVAYNPLRYPYWYIDANGNGTAEPGEVSADTQWAQWTPNLLRSAYNYQFVAKDPGAFAHNADYILQVLYDSIEALGGEAAVESFTRAPVRY